MPASSITAVTLVARHGSREALARAAADLLASTPGVVDVACGRGDDPGTVLATVSAHLPASTLMERARAVAQRLGGVLEVVDDLRSITRPLPARFPTEVLEHTADVGFVVHAGDRADLLAAAAEALAALMVDPAGVRPLEVVTLTVAADAPPWPDDERLRAWLAEVLYHLDAGRFAVRRAVVLEDGAAGVRGCLVGEALDEARHDVHGALKAVTYHGLAVGPDPDGTWRAQVIVDV